MLVAFGRLVDARRYDEGQSLQQLGRRTHGTWPKSPNSLDVLLAMIEGRASRIALQGRRVRRWLAVGAEREEVSLERPVLA